MNNPVTCVIPVRNGATTIERAVKSACEAGCVEVYVYDDYSTDDTYEVLKSLLPKYEQFNIVASPQFHVGANFARNCLIDYSNDNDLIICLDADDTLNDIAPLVAAWQPNTFVYGNHDEFQGEWVNVHKGAPIGTLPNKMVTGVTFLFHKDDWQKVGGFDPDFAYAEDYAFQCALVNAGIQGKYIDHTVYNRYLNPSGNERTILAGMYFEFYRTMARQKYQNVFKGVR